MTQLPSMNVVWHVVELETDGCKISPLALRDELTALSEEGWEVVNILRTPEQVLIVCSQPIFDEIETESPRRVHRLTTSIRREMRTQGG